METKKKAWKTIAVDGDTFDKLQAIKKEVGIPISQQVRRGLKLGVD